MNRSKTVSGLTKSGFTTLNERAAKTGPEMQCQKGKKSEREEARYDYKNMAETGKPIQEENNVEK
jgi:hypothetical protein